MRTAGAGEQKQSNSAFIYQKLGLSSGISVGDDLADNGVGAVNCRSLGQNSAPCMGHLCDSGQSALSSETEVPSV